MYMYMLRHGLTTADVPRRNRTHPPLKHAGHGRDRERRHRQPTLVHSPHLGSPAPFGSARAWQKGSGWVPTPRAMMQFHTRSRKPTHYVVIPQYLGAMVHVSFIILEAVERSDTPCTAWLVSDTILSQANAIKIPVPCFYGRKYSG